MMDPIASYHLKAPNDSLWIMDYCQAKMLQVVGKDNRQL